MPVHEAVEIVELDHPGLSRVAEIDRTERIEALVRQHGEDLVEEAGEWDSPGWDAHGSGEHSVAAKVRELEGYADRGGVAIGALRGSRLVGLGVVVPEVRPAVAQLAFLHVTAPERSTGVGRRLCEVLDGIAVGLGQREMVVSATPSARTVRFYLDRGFRPMAEPLAELVELEPEDVHMGKVL